MSQAIIYPIQDGKIAILWPAPIYPVEEVAKKDVPKDVPYLIIESTDLPQDGAFRDAWTADFSNPDGYGQGYSEWFAQNVQNAGNVPQPPVVPEKDKLWPKV